MERDRVNYLNRLAERDKRLFVEEPMGVNLAELIRQTDAGLQPRDWEVYSKVVVGDERNFTTFYKKFTYEGKISVIKDVKGKLSVSEYDFDYAKRILGESYIQTTKKNNHTRVFTPAVTMVRRKTDGSLVGFGDFSLANAYKDRFEKLNPSPSVWEDSEWRGEEVTSEEKISLNTSDEAISKPENVPNVQTQDLPDKAEVDNAESSEVENEEAQGTAVIIAATAAALKEQFDVERARDKEEYEKRLDDQKVEHDEFVRKLQEERELEKEESERAHQAQVDQLREDYEGRIEELSKNNFSGESVSVGYPEFVVYGDLNYKETENEAKPDKRSEEILYNGAAKGENGKFTSVKEHQGDEKREIKTNNKAEKPMLLDSELISYELNNGLRLGSPNTLVKKQEIIDEVNILINSSEAKSHDMGWIEVEIRKIIKKYKPSYTKTKLSQFRLLQPGIKKEE